MILWPILNARIHSGDLMVTLDRWSVYSLSRWVHTLDHIWASFSTLRPSSHNWCSEMVAILWVDPRVCRCRISLVLKSMPGLCNSNHGNPKKMGCSGILIILNDTTHAKLSRTILTGSDSSMIFPEAMGWPSMTTTEAGHWSFLRDIWWAWEMGKIPIHEASISSGI